ncbi:hypothetical protein [Photobacterium lutimaris]|uniref:Uncharacterized protein n=1 Tax=Photobacterium lutimaris TaxID=388278 RepID=A0A2T3IZP3_9GAMM|nr:hypothetical protein [Photobacterium lutimaris]PSU34158.1 hypothetical protein C9I99_09195 [Photobacterium lutimaris]TDR75732.1 hypothetical protein DFP78_10489 [Photobacterium lutimaris]
MNKGIYIGAAVGVLAVMVFTLGGKERQPINTALPDQPSFAISTAFDGRWEGERIDISGDKICLETRVIGKIEQGKVELTLMYNNTVLRGWISKDGILALYADSPRWGYRFAGTAQNNRIDGQWRVTNAPCHGEWYLEKKLT